MWLESDELFSLTVEHSRQRVVPKKKGKNERPQRVEIQEGDGEDFK